MSLIRHKINEFNDKYKTKFEVSGFKGLQLSIICLHNYTTKLDISLFEKEIGCTFQGVMFDGTLIFSLDI